MTSRVALSITKMHFQCLWTASRANEKWFCFSVLYFVLEWWMSGELCSVLLEEFCDVRVVTVLHIGLWRKNFLFLQSDCSIDFQVKIHVAHLFPEVTYSSWCSETLNTSNVSFSHGNQQFRNLIKRLHLNCVAQQFVYKIPESTNSLLKCCHTFGFEGVLWQKNLTV